MEERIKYLHIIFPESELKFGINLIKMIEDPENNFDINDHLFLARSREVYEKLSVYNVKIELITGDWDQATIINHFGKLSDWIFLHGIAYRFSIHRIKKEYRHKIIWRTWGHDGYRECKEYVQTALLKGIVKSLYDRFIYYKVLNSFYEVGIANSVDSIGLKKAKINLQQVRMPYPRRETSTIDYQKLLAERKLDGTLRVLVGHSGYSVDRHKYIIDLMKKYKGYNVLFFFPLSYGNQYYRVQVEKYALETLSSQAVIIKEFMNYEDYVKLLSQIDIGIFAGRFSYALGNIATMLRLQKTIYLDNKGILSEAFRLENIPYKSINEISNMKYDDFSKTLDYSCDPKWTLLPHSYEDYVLEWKNCLKNLDSKKRSCCSFVEG